MDALEKLIAAESAELLRLQDAVKAQEIKVETLLLAASARPLMHSGGAKVRQKTGSRGKPKGSISRVWRDVMPGLRALRRSFKYADMASCYTEMHKTEITMSAVRDRARNFVELGYFEALSDGSFEFTEFAIEKFGLNKIAQNENGATKAAPEGGLDSRPIHPPYETPSIFD